MEFANRPAELSTLLRILDGIRQCSFGNTEGLCGTADTTAVQRHHCDLKAFAFLTEEIFCRNFNVLEYQFHRLGSIDTHFIFFFTESKAFHSFFKDECADTFRSLRFISHGKDNVNIGGTAVGDKNLGAVQYIMVAFFSCNSLLSCSIRAGIGLGQGERAQHRAFAKGF